MEFYDILNAHGLNKRGLSASLTHEKNRRLANLTAFADVHDRVTGAQDVFYDLMDGTNDKSAGLLDLAKTLSTVALAAGETVLAGVDINGNQTSKITNASDATKFKVGQEITILDDVASENATVTRAESLNNTSTNTVTDQTVVASAYTTNKNARPQVLDNGWHVETVWDNTNGILKFFKSEDEGQTFSLLATRSIDANSIFSVSSKGNTVYFLTSYNTGTGFMFGRFDATKYNGEDLLNTNDFSQTVVDSSQDATDSVSLAISSDKTTLWAAFATKNSTYPNSFNIRVVKGVISSTDNTVTWGTVTQVTSWNGAESATSPSVSFYKGSPRIVYAYNPDAEGNGSSIIYCATYDGSTWTYYGGTVHSESYFQRAPDLVADKNGVLLCAWHGKDATDKTYDNIRFSKSTDGGANWSAMEKLTTGNTLSKQNVSLTVDNNNNYFVTHSNGNYPITEHKFDGTSWTTREVFTGYQAYPSSLYDNTFSLVFSVPLTIFKTSEKVGFYGTWNAIKEQFYLEVSALVNSYKEKALIARTTANYDTTNKKISVGGWDTTATKTVTDATVVASAYDTSGNGGRKTTILDNGDIVSVVNDSANNKLIWFISNDGTTWSKLTEGNVGATCTGFSMVSKGSMVYTIANRDAQSANYFFRFDASTVGTGTVAESNPDTGQSDFGEVSLTTNADKTKLYGSASTKNATYPNSFNIRYYEAPINADGTVGTWSVTQVTTQNTTGDDCTNPAIVVRSNGDFSIIYRILFSNGANYIQTRNSTSGSWTTVNVYSGGSYTQDNPSAIFIPSTYSQSGSDEIHVCWQGYDSTVTNYYNLRHAISTDGGANWTVTKITSDSTNHNYYPSVTANKNGKLFITYYRSDTYYQIRKIEYDNGTWSAITQITNSTTGHQRFPSTLFDNTFNLDFSEPLFIWQDGGSPKVGFYGTWTVGTTVPLLKSVARYNITPPTATTAKIAAWVNKVNTTGVTLGADLSIVDTLANESYQAMTNSNTAAIDTTIDELEFVGSVATPEEKVTLKLNLERTSTSTDAYLTKVLGAIAD